MFQLESKGHDLSEGEWSPVARLFSSSAVNLQFGFGEVLFMPLFVSVLMFGMENCLLPYVSSLYSKPIFFFQLLPLSFAVIETTTIINFTCSF